MNPDNENSNNLALPDPLEKLQQALARVQLQLIITTIICVFALTGVTVALSLLLGQDDSTVAAETLQVRADESAEELRQLRSRFDALLSQISVNSAGVSHLTEQLAEVDMHDQNNVIVRLQRILIRQERDYRDFLTHLENGLYNFHMMVPHSRSWWTDYREELVRSAELSKARENYVVNLRNN